MGVALLLSVSPLSVPAGRTVGFEDVPASAVTPVSPVPSHGTAHDAGSADSAQPPLPSAATGHTGRAGLFGGLPFSAPSRPIAPTGTGYGPQPGTVNPFAHYATEPAPMGVADFGLTSSGTGYTYSTSRFLGTMQIRSWTTQASGGLGGGWISVQLNVVLVLTSGSTTMAYWIQNVPIFNTTSHAIDFENNIWNMSASGAGLASGSVSGNGSIYNGQFYAVDAASNYNGSGTTLSLPVNISVDVVASTISGVTHVGFRFNDGYGWQTYDNVSFPWSSGWTDHGFVVDGTAYNGYGLYNDAELIVGGPCCGSTASTLGSSVSFVLDLWNGHNFQAVPNAYNFGSDTAETVSNVVESLPSGTAPGAPGAVMKNGSGSLARLYDRGSTGVLTVTSGLANGTLNFNTGATPYRGTLVNLTLMPGTYHIAVKNGSWPYASKNVTLSGGQTVRTTMPKVVTTPWSARAQASANVTGSNFAPGSTVHVTWTGAGVSLCNATVSATGGFSCTFTVPKTAAGLHAITATDTSTSANSGTWIFNLTTDLKVAGAISATITDVGLSVGFTANATGGYTPYANYTWRFGDGTSVTNATGTATHVYAIAGMLHPTVQAVDAVGSSVNDSVGLTVHAAPTASAPSPSAVAADIGQTVTFTTTASLGTPPYVRYGWAGLGAGCTPSPSARLTCTFVSRGTLLLTATVTDSLGATSVSSPVLYFSVSALPTVSTPVASRSSVDIGQPVLFHVTGTDGSGNTVYTWSGLPPGCYGTTASIGCRPTGAGTFTVGARVTDSNGGSASNGSLRFTVFVLPTFPSHPTPSHPSADVGQSVSMSAVASNGSGGFLYNWRGLPAGCSAVNGPTLTCAPTAIGNYTVVVTATDSNAATASLSFPFPVTPRLSVSGPNASRGSTDVGYSIMLTTRVVGGSGGVLYAWSGLPPGCGTSNARSLWCTPTAEGTWAVAVNATDSNGGTASGSVLQLVVNQQPSIPSIARVPNAPLVGHSLALRATTVGGTPHFAFAWSGLPPGCVGTNATAISCVPTGSGTFVVIVGLADAVGAHTNGTLTLTVGDVFLGLPALEGYGVVGAVVGAAVLATLVVMVRRARRRVHLRPDPAAAGPAPPPARHDALPTGGPSAELEVAAVAPTGAPRFTPAPAGGAAPVSETVIAPGPAYPGRLSCPHCGAPNDAWLTNCRKCHWPLFTT